MHAIKTANEHKRRAPAVHPEQLESLLDLVRLRRAQLTNSLDDAERLARRNVFVRARSTIARPGRD